MARLLLPATTIPQHIFGDIDNEYALIFFFPMINAVDSTEVIALKNSLDRFAKLDCKVIGVTDENKQTLARWVKLDPQAGGFGQEIGFDVVTDKGHSIAKTFGAQHSSGHPCRAVYILDKNRTVRHASFYPRYVGRNIENLITSVAAVRKMDQTNTIIPAAWQPTDKTIQKSSKGVHEYYDVVTDQDSFITGQKTLSDISSKSPPSSSSYASAKSSVAKSSSSATTSDKAADTPAPPASKPSRTSTEPKEGKKIVLTIGGKKMMCVCTEIPADDDQDHDTWANDGTRDVSDLASDLEDLKVDDKGAAVGMQRRPAA